MEDKRAVLVVSFGTSHQKTREKTLDVIEKEIGAAFEGYDLRRAYTSPMPSRAAAAQKEGTPFTSLDSYPWAKTRR